MILMQYINSLPVASWIAHHSLWLRRCGTGFQVIR